MNGLLGDYEQFRITQVQLLNWGAFCGLVSVPMEREGTAVLGPSGVGKSTLLDGMASVIFPNPQEFNQAARDDLGSKRERTPYSYARGQTEQVIDGSGKSTETRYLRPPGSKPFASGVAISWRRDDGRTVTVFRVAWVASDAGGAESITKSTVYGFVNDHFDLSRLNGLTGYRQNASPLAPASVRTLVDTSRGDIVEDTQSRVHAKMRDAMGMGDTEESQRLALQLLRRAQASKGIANINALFTDFVLTEPQALSRWNTTLEALLEAFRLYDEYAEVDRKLKTLERLPVQAESYRAADQGSGGKRKMLYPQSDGARERLRIWHASAVYNWAERAIDDVRLGKADLAEELRGAQAEYNDAESAFEDALAAMTAAGGDRAEALTAKKEAVETERNRILAQRHDLTDRLAQFGFHLPGSDGELALLRAQIGDGLKGIDNELQAAQRKSNDKVYQAGDAAKRAREAARLLKELSARRSNIDPRDAVFRDQISRATGIPAERLMFFGELIQVRDDSRQWERAVHSVLSGVARDLVVSPSDLQTVRSWVNSTDTGRRVTIAEATPPREVKRPIVGTVPDVLDIADSPHANWVLNELVRRFSYRLVERDIELDEPLALGMNGAVTRAGMRTAANGRYVKDDTRATFTGIGWDTSRVRRELEQQLEAARIEEHASGGEAGSAQDQYDRLRDRRTLLDGTSRDLRWEAIDIAPLGQRISDLQRQITAANSPEVNEQRAKLNDAKARQNATNGKIAMTKEKLDRLEASYAQLCTAQDYQSRVIESEPELTEAERSFTADLTFSEPAVANAESERAFARAVEESYRLAEKQLLEQADNLLKLRSAAEGGVLSIMRAYRGLGDAQASEIDETVESLAALLAIYEQLIADDLPRTRSRWLEKANSDMSSQLVLLMRTIEEDRRGISAGLDPINNVLASVSFRASSTLRIEAVDAATRPLDEFRSIVTQYTDGAIGRDDAATERAFVVLREKVRGLTDQKATAAETWRRQVFDARTHMTFRATESRLGGETAVWDGVSGMSGGEGQELIAFILGAALRYRLGEGTDKMPIYASIVLDEGFVKSDSDYTGRAMAAIKALGFQVIIGAPREKASALQDYVTAVAYIARLKEGEVPVGAWPITMDEALALDNVA